MTDKTERPQHLFIVRLWQEPSASAPPGQWRGSAEHVPTGERVYFCALDDLSGFIARQMEAAPATAAEAASKEIGRSPDG